MQCRYNCGGNTKWVDKIGVLSQFFFNHHVREHVKHFARDACNRVYSDSNINSRYQMINSVTIIKWVNWTINISLNESGYIRKCYKCTFNSYEIKKQAHNEIIKKISYENNEKMKWTLHHRISLPEICLSSINLFFMRIKMLKVVQFRFC